MKLTLKERLLNEVNNGLPFMVGREKDAIELGETITIKDYGFLTGEDGEFICFIDNTNHDKYFFGGSVLTEKFKQIENAFTPEEIQELLSEGIDIICTEKKSKNNRKYVSVEFK